MSFAFWLNFVFALVEFFGGIFSQSFAVSSNALHDLGDSLALALAVVLEKKSLRGSDAHFSYGYRRYSMASAFLTSVFLVTGSLLVIYFGVRHISEPSEPKSLGMIGFAVLGMAVNALSLWRLSKGRSLNEQVLSWHFVEDTLGWALVLVAGLLIRWTGWAVLDVILGMALAVWILWNVQKSLFEVINIFLQATPKNISTEEITQEISRLSFVKNVHHLHLWTLDGQMHVLTAHICLNSADASDWVQQKNEIKKLLKQRFSISEATLEFEWPSESCQDPVHS